MKPKYRFETWYSEGSFQKPTITFEVVDTEKEERAWKLLEEAHVEIRRREATPEEIREHLWK